MGPFFSRLPLSLSDTALPSYRIWTLLSAVAIPAICALAVFLFLKNAPPARKLACFFISLPFFMIPALFLLSGPGGSFSPVIGAETASLIPEEAGFIAAIALGTAYLGINIIICSAGVMRLAGRTLAVVFTIFSVFAEMFLLALTVETPRGAKAAMADYFAPMSKLGGNLSYFAKCSPDVFALIVFALFILLVFCCFFANKTKTALAEEDLAREHALAELEQARQTSPDAPRCALCVHAAELRTEDGKMLCDTHGAVSEIGLCKRFEYDPLKRPVPDPATAESASPAAPGTPEAAESTETADLDAEVSGPEN